MATLLNIDTATEYASVCISNDDVSIGIRVNPTQKEHASFLHVAIAELLEEGGLTPAAIDAIAITKGPGSYTGLRVGMATAKGLCYALEKPLIAVNTLDVMVLALLQQMQKAKQPAEDALLCPMIDARRMEVFTAMYNRQLQAVLQPCAMIIEEHTFDQWSGRPIYFSGSGSKKLEAVKQQNFFLLNCQHDAAHLAKIASNRYNEHIFDDIVYLEPDYLKNFYVPGKMD